jgi:hypothetical protein
MAVRGSSDTVGDAAMHEATGRAPEEWFALLDAAGANGWRHPEIAAWLRDEHGVDAWWCQSVTVRYEQARGMRLPGQQADGTFAASSSRTIDGPLDEAYGRAVTAVTAAHGSPTSARASGARPFARFAAAGGGSVLVTAEATAAGRVKVAAVHERLASPEAAADAKAALAGLLREL